MKFKKFVMIVKEELEKKYPEMKFEIRKVMKLNHITLTGIMVYKEPNIAPTIYMESFYDDYTKGKSILEIIKEVEVYIHQEPEITKEWIAQLENYNNIYKNIYMKLINYKKNKELLQEIPHKRYLNLAIIFYYSVESENQLVGSVTVRNEHLKIWNITMDTLYGNAMKYTNENLGQKIYNMRDIIENMLAGKEDGYDAEVLKGVVDEMYILSNRNKNFGASAILQPKIIREFAEHNKLNFYLLPSSIHEWVMLSTMEETQAESLQKLVREINETQVREEEILGDSIYYYDYHTKKIRILLE